MFCISKQVEHANLINVDSRIPGSAQSVHTRHKIKPDSVAQFPLSQSWLFALLEKTCCCWENTCFNSRNLAWSFETDRVPWRPTRSLFRQNNRPVSHFSIHFYTRQSVDASLVPVAWKRFLHQVLWHLWLPRNTLSSFQHKAVIFTWNVRVVALLQTGIHVASLTIERSELAILVDNVLPQNLDFVQSCPIWRILNLKSDQCTELSGWESILLCLSDYTFCLARWTRNSTHFSVGNIQHSPIQLRRFTAFFITVNSDTWGKSPSNAQRMSNDRSVLPIKEIHKMSDGKEIPTFALKSGNLTATISMKIWMEAYAKTEA